MNIIYFLTESNEIVQLESPIWAWIILLVLLTTPWIGLIVYLCRLKYRVRVFVFDHLFSTAYLKKNQSIRQSIVLPTSDNCYIELYLDPEFTEPLVVDEMPKQNLKIYVKYEPKSIE